jgi:hypothetical protein
VRANGRLFSNENLLIYQMPHNFKKYFKDGIKIIISHNANPVTIVMQLSKKQLFKFLDQLLPDEKEESAVK